MLEGTSMKLTTKQIKQIIQEEFKGFLDETLSDVNKAGYWPFLKDCLNDSNHSEEEGLDIATQIFGKSYDYETIKKYQEPKLQMKKEKEQEKKQSGLDVEKYLEDTKKWNTLKNKWKWAFVDDTFVELVTGVYMDRIIDEYDELFGVNTWSDKQKHEILTKLAEITGQLDRLKKKDPDWPFELENEEGYNNDYLFNYFSESAHLTTNKLKQIIKEELDLLQLPLEWVSIKKEWESLKQFKFPETAAWRMIDLGVLNYSAKDKEQTIKKYPQYFPSGQDRGWVDMRSASPQLHSYGMPVQNEEGEWGYWDDTKEKPFEWTAEGVFNVWTRDQLGVIQSHINKIKKFYQQKIRPFQSELVLQLREQMKYGIGGREGEDLIRVVNDFVKTEPPSFDWFGNQSNTLAIRDSSRRYSQVEKSTVSIKQIRNELRQLKSAFESSRDLISRWKSRIDRS